MQTDNAIAANRFGLGAKPGDLESIGDEPKGWLLAQIDAPAEQHDVFNSLPHSSATLREVQELRRDKSEQFGKMVREHYTRQVLARYQLATSTDMPFRERLVHFWSNHFAVSADKQPLPSIAAMYEHEAIRPNVTGRFVDLLLAAERHPAMIMYLDNQRSMGPNSRAVKRRQARTDQELGLNENLAREILELHTLGVDGGYTQNDVTVFAKAITGWSVGNKGGSAGRYEFRRAIHEPGKKKVLGTSYAQDGEAQGVAILEDLAASPVTAKFLANKLARHFVSDQPPAALVDKLAKAYLDNDGALSAVYATLVEADESWADPYAKYKTPHDYVVSTMRAFDYVPNDRRRLFVWLEFLGQIPFRPESPAGWPDTADEWGASDALLKRITWADTVGRFGGRRSRAAELGDAVLGPSFTESESRKAVARAESPAQSMTLLLASPEFQRR